MFNETIDTIVSPLVRESITKVLKDVLTYLPRSWDPYDKTGLPHAISLEKRRELCAERSLTYTADQTLKLTHDEARTYPFPALAYGHIDAANFEIIKTNWPVAQRWIETSGKFAIPPEVITAANVAIGDLGGVLIEDTKTALNQVVMRDNLELYDNMSAFGFKNHPFEVYLAIIMYAHRILDSIVDRYRDDLCPIALGVMIAISDNFAAYKILLRHKIQVSISPEIIGLYDAYRFVEYTLDEKINEWNLEEEINKIDLENDMDMMSDSESESSGDDDAGSSKSSDSDSDSDGSSSSSDGDSDGEGLDSDSDDELDPKKRKKQRQKAKGRDYDLECNAREKYLKRVRRGMREVREIVRSYYDLSLGALPSIALRMTRINNYVLMKRFKREGESESATADRVRLMASPARHQSPTRAPPAARQAAPAAPTAPAGAQPGPVFPSNSASGAPITSYAAPAARQNLDPFGRPIVASQSQPIEPRPMPTPTYAPPVPTAFGAPLAGPGRGASPMRGTSPVRGAFLTKW
jgi:hypothetical protein